MEWKNEFNSFNSLKGLFYKKWFEKILERKFLPPVEASLDPIHACNLRCEHCNAHRYLKNSVQRMSKNHLYKLIDFLSKWGVKAICFGGGGEPTLHPNIEEALERTKARGLEASVATNGTVITESLADTMAKTCRWVGVSVDAATSKTYEKGKKRDYFDIVINNLKRLSKKAKEADKNCDVCYKFLITPYNQHEIYKAAKLAKSIGVKDFHARPADFRHQGMGELKKKNNQYLIKNIKKQFEKCHKLEDDNFRVFTVMHKFTDEFIPRKDFTRCLGAPLVIQLCADGNVYFCVDQRHRPEFVLGQHYPEPKQILDFWGGKKHQELVFGDTAKKCTTRCTFGIYCKMCEEVFGKGKDPFCWRFV